MRLFAKACWNELALAMRNGKGNEALYLFESYEKSSVRESTAAPYQEEIQADSSSYPEKKQTSRLSDVLTDRSTQNLLGMKKVHENWHPGYHTGLLEGDGQ